MPKSLRRTLLTGASHAALTLLAAAPLGVSLAGGALAADLVIDQPRDVTVRLEDEGVILNDSVFVQADVVVKAGSAIDTDLRFVTIENNALLSSTAVDGITMQYGKVVNLAGATIYGVDDGVTSYDAVEIINEGTIRGVEFGVDLFTPSAGLQNKVTNRGIIRGDYHSIDFFFGDDILILDTGSQLLGARLAAGGYEAGYVDASGGVDSLYLQGVGSEDATFAYFEKLEVRAGADWTLSGKGTFYDSITALGRLRNEGTIGGGDLTVYAGGAFGGGTVVLTGDATFEAGSRFLADFGSEAGTMQVAGTVTTEGVIPVEVSQRGTIENGQSFVLLTAGTINGDFEAEGNTLRLAFAIETGPDRVTATASVQTFQEAGATENQQATGAALDAAEANGGAEFEEVIATVDSLGLVAGAAILDAFSGDFHASTASTGLVSARSFLEGVAGRVGAAGSGGQVAGLGQVASLTQVAAGPLPSGPGAGFAAWAALEGTFGTLEDENAGDTDYDSFGGTVGGDFAVMPNLFLGAAVGFAVGSSETADRGATADSTVVRLAGYGRWFSGPISVTGAVGASFGSLESERATPLGLATGETDATAFGFAAEGRYALALGGFTVSPLAGVSFTTLTQDAFEETGAGAATLSVGEATADSFRASLGAVASKAIRNGGTTITPEARLLYRHEFAEGFGEVSNAFLADATATSFTVIGAEPAADVVELGAGVTAELANGMSLFGDLGFTLGDGQSETNVAAGLRMSF